MERAGEVLVLVRDRKSEVTRAAFEGMRKLMTRWGGMVWREEGGGGSNPLKGKWRLGIPVDAVVVYYRR